jgi:hypothetical protein
MLTLRCAAMPLQSLCHQRNRSSDCLLTFVSNGKHKRDIRNTCHSNRSTSMSCCSLAHPQSLWHHRHQCWHLNGIATAQHVTTTTKPRLIPYHKGRSISTSCWFPMQLRLPLHHRHECWYLHSKPSTYPTKYSFIPERLIDVNVVLHCNVAAMASLPTELIKSLPNNDGQSTKAIQLKQLQLRSNDFSVVLLSNAVAIDLTLSSPILISNIAVVSHEEQIRSNAYPKDRWKSELCCFPTPSRAIRLHRLSTRSVSRVPLMSTIVV